MVKSKRISPHMLATKNNSKNEALLLQSSISPTSSLQ